MATLLKVPPERGVVVFTTQERDKFIKLDKDLRRKIEALKPKWLVGLHHNWHDYAFKRDPIFDFSMAGKGDLVGDKTPLVELDACNFAPDCFNMEETEKHWDVLYVARTVFFKRTNVFFNAIRRLYDMGSKARVLLLTPVKDRDANHELLTTYGKFSQEERQRFTLIAPTHDYPFPYDIETVAFFYRHSKVFAHFADEERRCRVVAYAAACGLPVICRAHPASIIPSHVRKQPACYLVQRDVDFAKKIQEALDVWPVHKGTGMARPYFAQQHTIPYLKDTIHDQFGINQNNYNTANLDIRLGRHLNIATGTNRIPLDINKFVEFLSDEQKITKASKHLDPEMELAK